MDFTIWKILGIITLILLIVFWRKRNAVWSGATIGAVLGLMVAVIFIFKGSEFNWSIIGKGITLGAIVGFVIELIGKVTDLIKKRELKKRNKS